MLEIHLALSLLLSQGTLQQDGSQGQAARSVCDTIAAIVAQVKGAEVTRTDGPMDDFVQDRTHAACHVIVTGKWTALEKKTMPPQILIERELRARGWEEDVHYRADGPDGGVFAVRRGQVLCLVDAHWDGGLDDDPSYVPSDDYTVDASCTHPS